MAVCTKPGSQALVFHLPGFNLAATLQCGQTFSWQRQGGAFHGVAGGRAVEARQQGERLILSSQTAFTPEDEAFWHHYFALDIDYEGLKARFGRHKKLAACVAAAPGIRVLRQPFFDTLLSFIISQNNHIPRIHGIVQRLRQQFGPQLANGEYGFPAPQTLAALAPEELAPLRAGFRAKYLIDAARKVAAGTVSEAALAPLPDADARRLLMQIQGVGEKVADCVLLYSQGRSRVVPMDVWMKRATAQTFPRGMPAAARGSEGIAQQFIFFWARENLQK